MYTTPAQKELEAQRNKRLTDCQKVAAWLHEKGSITPDDAESFGCRRLGARIWELRHEQGLDIETKLVKAAGGDKYARYTLKPATATI